jgi:hypothetical protein
MSEETKKKIAATIARKKEETKGEPVVIPPEAPVNTGRLTNEPTIPDRAPPTFGLAATQPTLTKEECIEFVFNISPEAQRHPDFKEPTYGGLYWKANHEDVEERGWCLVKMSDGSFNLVEHR